MTAAYPPSHPDRLATAVKRRRLLLGLTAKQLADTAGISSRAVSYIEAGADHELRDDTLDGLDQALLWTQGSARRVYRRGGRPVSRAQPPAPTPRLTEVQTVTRAGLPRPIELELLAHLAARRQDMEAALEAEATMLVGMLGRLLARRDAGGVA